MILIKWRIQVLLFVLGTWVRMGETQVPPNYHQFPGERDSAYRLYTTPLTWREAMRVCQRDGGVLAVINSSEEERQFKMLLTRTLGPQYRVHASTHTSAPDERFTNVLGGTLSEPGFRAWKVTPAGRINREDCGIMKICNRFIEIPCDESLPFICEVDLDFA